MLPLFRYERNVLDHNNSVIDLNTNIFKEILHRECTFYALISISRFREGGKLKKVGYGSDKHLNLGIMISDSEI